MMCCVLRARCDAVSRGTSIPQAITRPVSIAMPTVMPMRWPAPIRANELDAPIPVEPLPMRKYTAVSDAISFAVPAAANSAEAMDPQITPRKPTLPSAAPSRVAVPTFSTSAAATPFGLKRWSSNEVRLLRFLSHINNTSRLRQVQLYAGREFTFVQSAAGYSI